MPWDMNKCRWGVPQNFTNADATTAVQNADFNASVYVNISTRGQNTKQAYTYYNFGGFRLCVGGHVHRNPAGQWTIAGGSFICGWEAWEIPTPAGQVAVIGPLPTGGTFPGDDRYPHPIP